MACPRLCEVESCRSYNERLPAISGWLEAISSSPKDAVTTVFSGRLEDVAQSPSVDRFLGRLCKLGYCSSEVFIATAVFVQRFLEINAMQLSKQSVHRVILAAFVSAVKVTDDTCFTNSFYADLGGVSLQELNMIERTFLNAMDWNLVVSTAQHHQILCCLAATEMCSDDEVESPSTPLPDVEEVEAPVVEVIRRNSFLSARSESLLSFSTGNHSALSMDRSCSRAPIRNPELRCLSQLAIEMEVEMVRAMEEC